MTLSPLEKQSRDEATRLPADGGAGFAFHLPIGITDSALHSDERPSIATRVTSVVLLFAAIAAGRPLHSLA